jgi:hypothetical protein
MRIHQQRSAASEIEQLYAIAVREHGPQGRSSRILKQELDRELRRVSEAPGLCEAPAFVRGRGKPVRIRQER